MKYVCWFDFIHSLFHYLFSLFIFFCWLFCSFCAYLFSLRTIYIYAYIHIIRLCHSWSLIIFKLCFKIVRKKVSILVVCWFFLYILQEKKTWITHLDDNEKIKGLTWWNICFLSLCFSLIVLLYSRYIFKYENISITVAIVKNVKVWLRDKIIE